MTMRTLMTVLAVALAFAVGTMTGHHTQQPTIEKLYEDGSGHLTDGRSFCLANHPCCENHEVP